MQCFPGKCIFLWHWRMLFNRINTAKNSSVVCFASSKHFNSGYLSKIETKWEKSPSHLLPSFQLTCLVASDLRSRKFGNMKDSGGAESRIKLTFSESVSLSPKTRRMTLQMMTLQMMTLQMMTLLNCRKKRQMIPA